MAKDIIARLKADTSGWDNGLTKAQRSLKQFEQQNLTAEGAINSMTKSLMSAATKYVSMAAAAEAAFKTIKGAIESTEATHDAYARVVAECDAVSNQFFRTLATADFSTFLKGMDQIVAQAREAYNAMDDFESYAARFNPYQQKMESQIQTKMMQARAAKAKGDLQQANKLSKEAEGLIDELEGSVRDYGARQTKGGYSTIKNLMGGVSVTNKQIDYLANPNNWDKINAKAAKYAKLMADANADQVGGMKSAGATAEAKARAAAARATLASDPSLKRAYTFQNLRDSGDSSEAAAFIKALTDINGNTLASSRVESLRARAERLGGTLSGSGRSGGTTSGKGASSIAGVDIQEMKGLGDSLDDMQPKAIDARRSVAELTAEISRLKQAADNTTDMQERKRLLKEAGSLQNSIANNDMVQPGGIIFDTDAMHKNMQEAISEGGAFYIDVKATTTSIDASAKKMEESWSVAANAISQVGSALNGLNEPAINVATMIAQTIATLGLTYAQTLAQDKSSKNIWAFIAAATASAISLATTAASYKKSMSTDSYAEGGILKSNSYVGDSTLFYGNAGEVVLSAAGQENLASQLQNGGGVAEITVRQRGEDMISTINAAGMRMGKGKLQFG